jgi:Na+-translocating ferredoxin:NAD+ oxidoreductase RnfE subunit
MKLKLAILTIILLGWTAPALSQGCAMCYSSAQATSKDGQRAINRGVLLLLIPPAGFMTLGIWMAQRYARKRDLEQYESV